MLHPLRTPSMLPRRPARSNGSCCPESSISARTSSQVSTLCRSVFRLPVMREFGCRAASVGGRTSSANMTPAH
jgi:hypothetical protein